MQVPDAVYVENLSLTVKDGATGETAELALYESTGYDPQLWTGSLTAPESREIMVTLESGGSGGTCYYSVFGAKDDFSFEATASALPEERARDMRGYFI